MQVSADPHYRARGDVATQGSAKAPTPDSIRNYSRVLVLVAGVVVVVVVVVERESVLSRVVRERNDGRFVCGSRH